MVELARAGLFIYALDLDRVVAFYEAVAGMTRLREVEGMIVLGSADMQLVVHRIPPQHAEGLVIDSPPERRESAALKFYFTVASLEVARRLAIAHGGDVSHMAWQDQELLVCNGSDPEGNIFQLRQRLTDLG